MSRRRYDTASNYVPAYPPRITRPQAVHPQQGASVFIAIAVVTLVILALLAVGVVGIVGRWQHWPAQTGRQRAGVTGPGRCARWQRPGTQDGRQHGNRGRADYRWIHYRDRPDCLGQFAGPGGVVLYLSSTYANILPRYKDRFGYMLNVNRTIGGEKMAVNHVWMLDNGAFSDSWDSILWRERMDTLSEYADTCIGAVVPDTVADAEGTIRKWHKYAWMVKELGYPAAFVAQDGLTVDMVPWDDEVDVLFIGGSTDYKLYGAWDVIREALDRKLWVHVGRVNSVARILRFCMCDSCDGTTLSIEPSIRNQEKILWACEQCKALRMQRELLSMPV